MIRSTQGIIHGKTIELVEDLGVAEGQRVEVQVKIIATDRQWGDGLRESAGALANEWTQEDDAILSQVHRDRRGELNRLLSDDLL